MRIWLPGIAYKTLPLLTGVAGGAGCLAGSLNTGSISCLSLGFVLIIYSGTILLMRL